MLELIVFRALQGIGGGWLAVIAQTIIGDIVSPRERGRYQGLFGAVFGVSSIAGPLVAGFLVDNFSWHWVFYVNLPIGQPSPGDTALALPRCRGRACWCCPRAGGADSRRACPGSRAVRSSRLRSRIGTELRRRSHSA